MITWHKYIPIHSFLYWMALGWEVSDLDSHHSRYSVLGTWKGIGDPIMPR